MKSDLMLLVAYQGKAYQPYQFMKKSNIFMIIAVFMVKDVAYGTMGGHGLRLLLATQLGSGGWEHAILVLSLMIKWTPK